MKNKKPNFYYVYIITNNISKKQYVGSRICYKNKIEEDNYWGSSDYLEEDYNIIGKENFTKEILKDDYQNAYEMLEGESHYMLKHNTLAPNGYNHYLPNTKKGFYMAGIKQSKETIEKRVKKLKGKTFSKEHIKNLSKAHIGLKDSGMTGKHHNDETKRILSNITKKQFNTEAALIMHRELTKNAMQRPEVKEKQRLGIIKREQNRLLNKNKLK